MGGNLTHIQRSSSQVKQVVEDREHYGNSDRMKPWPRSKLWSQICYSNGHNKGKKRELEPIIKLFKVMQMKRKQNLFFIYHKEFVHKSRNQAVLFLWVIVFIAADCKDSGSFSFSWAGPGTSDMKRRMEQSKCQHHAELEPWRPFDSVAMLLTPRSQVSVSSASQMEGTLVTRQRGKRWGGGQAKFFPDSSRDVGRCGGGWPVDGRWSKLQLSFQAVWKDNKTGGIKTKHRFFYGELQGTYCPGIRSSFYHGD